MKNYLRLIRNQELIAFWERNKAEFTVDEMGQIYGLKTTGAWQVINEYEKNKDPQRFIKNYIIKSDKEIRAKIKRAQQRKEQKIINAKISQLKVIDKAIKKI